jgi:hypothetical protein
LVDTSTVVDEKTKSKQNNRPTDDLEEDLQLSYVLFLESLETERHSHAHDEDEPREDEIRHGQAVPSRVVEKPISS